MAFERTAEENLMALAENLQAALSPAHNTRLTELERDIADMTMQRDVMCEKLNEYIDKTVAAERERDAALKLNRELNDQLFKLSGELGQAQADEAKAAQSLAGAEARVAELEAELDDLRAKLNSVVLERASSRLTDQERHEIAMDDMAEAGGEEEDKP